MKTTPIVLNLISVVLVSAIFNVVAVGQETKKYSNAGVTFEYLPGWVMSEQAAADSQQISLANSESDSQILLIVLRERIDSKDPMADLKKQVIDPWVAQLVGQYTRAGIKVIQEKSATEVGGQQAEGSTLKFFLDEQPGRGEAYWTLLDKRLVLLYFIRPDRTADNAEPGWVSIRKTLQVKAAK